MFRAVRNAAYSNYVIHHEKSQLSNIHSFSITAYPAANISFDKKETRQSFATDFSVTAVNIGLKLENSDSLNSTLPSPYFYPC